MWFWTTLYHHCAYMNLIINLAYITISKVLIRRVEGMFHWIKCLSHKHEDLSLDLLGPT